MTSSRDRDIICFIPIFLSAKSKIFTSHITLLLYFLGNLATKKIICCTTGHWGAQFPFVPGQLGLGLFLNQSGFRFGALRELIRV